MSRTAKLLAELIALPSVNPAYAPPNDPQAGEQRVADFLAAEAARAGLEIEFQNVMPGRSNLLARLRPAGKPRQRILLAPHLDTVNPASDTQFTPRKKADRLYGRGACDTKGSIAAMLTALGEVARSKSRPRHTEIVFAGLIDEEHGQSGSRALANSGFRAALAIVGEPTGLRVVTAHKGSLWLRLETRGRAAHGSAPQFGRNAILAMARVVQCLQTDYAARLRRRRHPLLGCATVSVGTIAGGTQPNMVPDHCAIEIDRRSLPGETEATVRREIGALLLRKGLRARITDAKRAPCWPLDTNVCLPLVQQFLRCAGQSKPVGAPFFCDAAVLAHSGTPSVVFGPGNLAQAHTADEWISLAQLERGHDLLLHFLKSLP